MGISRIDTAPRPQPITRNTQDRCSGAPGGGFKGGSPPSANPWDMRNVRGPLSRMRMHLSFHRQGLSGLLVGGAARYVSEIYPVGEKVATDCSRVAFAVFAYLTGQCPAAVVAARGQLPLAGAACPDTSLVKLTPLVHYISLTQNALDPFDNSCGHRLVLLQAKGRVHVLHAFKDKFTLAEHMRSRHAASLTDAAFRTWWAELQAALALPDGARERAFNELLGADGFGEPVGESWMMTHEADLSGDSGSGSGWGPCF